MVHRIALRAQHIKAGKRASRSSCPVALAIKEAIAVRAESVDVLRSGNSASVEIRINNKPYVTWPRFAVDAFVYYFDHGSEVAPISFRIEAKTLVHDKGWRRKFINGKETVIFGRFGETRCGRPIGKTAIGYSRLIAFHADEASFLQQLKVRWRLFVINQVIAGSPKPYWADYCEECFKPGGHY